MVVNCCFQLSFSAAGENVLLNLSGVSSSRFKRSPHEMAATLRKTVQQTHLIRRVAYSRPYRGIGEGPQQTRGTTIQRQVSNGHNKF